ncbi:MAG: hypothetical protein WCW87_01375 [Candidatus Paceibacterota bacterium]
MKFNKKNVGKIKNATQEELNKLHEEYKGVSKNVSGMSLAGLMVIAVMGIAMILYFQNKLFVFVGLVMLLYPIYIFIKRGAHREGYFEGYYEMMKKFGDRDENTTSDKPDQK